MSVLGRSSITRRWSIAIWGVRVGHWAGWSGSEWNVAVRFSMFGDVANTVQAVMVRR